MQSLLGNPEIHIKYLFHIKNNQTNIKDRNNSQNFDEVSTKSYAFTSTLYSSTRNMKCPNLNCNINKVLLKGTVCLESYKWTNENNSN